MADSKQALTDEQIRSAFKDFNRTLMEYGRDVAVLETALRQKGLLTESDLFAAKKKVFEEGKEQLQKIASALGSTPPEGVQ